MQKHINCIKSDKRANLLKDIFVCNALDMSEIKDGVFDVVLCMGAYYHLQEKSEREKVVSECLRILKNTGILVIAYINRNAVFLNHFKINPIQAIENDNVILDGKNGVFYAVEFNEIKNLNNQFRLEEIANIGIDGFMYPLINEINSLDESQFKKYMDYHFLTCETPSILGNSMHGLYFAKKRT